MKLSFFKQLAAATIAAIAPPAIQAQAYPAKPITLVVPIAAGGPTDVLARMLGAAMTRTLGQSVWIEKKIGAADLPVTLLGRMDLSANNCNDLLAYLKANGDKVNLARVGLQTWLRS